MDPQVRIIGFSGKCGVGKNFLAEKVLPTALRGAPLSYMAFADQIKVEVGARNPRLAFGDLFGEKKEPGVRRLLQDHGARVRFSSGDATWIRAAELRLELDARRRAAGGGHPAFYVFTDLRFPAEAEWVRQKGGVLVRVEAPGRNAERVAAEEVNEQHLSETALDDYPHFDLTLSNERGKPLGVLELELREGVLARLGGP